MVVYYLINNEQYMCVCVFRNTMVMEMQELDKLRSQVQDVNVPLEVFE